MLATRYSMLATLFHAHQCAFPCSSAAIFLQNQYSMTGYTRAEMVNDKARLYELGGTLPDQHFKWDKKKAAAEHGNAH